MSVENLKEYALRCATDPELGAKAKEIGVANIEEQTRLAGTLGLDWTVEDLQAFRKEVADLHGDVDELSEEELAQVAGGIVTGTSAVAAAVVGVAVAAGAVAGAGAAAGVVATTGSASW